MMDRARKESLAMITADRIKELEERNKQRHPIKEEALAHYHWLKENSKRNK